MKKYLYTWLSLLLPLSISAQSLHLPSTEIIYQHASEIKLANFTCKDTVNIDTLEGLQRFEINAYENCEDKGDYYKFFILNGTVVHFAHMNQHDKFDGNCYVFHYPEGNLWNLEYVYVNSDIILSKKGESFWFDKYGKLYHYKYSNKDGRTLKDFELLENRFKYYFNVNYEELQADIQMLSERFELNIDESKIKVVEQMNVRDSTITLSSVVDGKVLKQTGRTGHKSFFNDHKFESSSIGNYPDGAIKYEYIMDEKGNGHKIKYYPNGAEKSTEKWEKHFRTLKQERFVNGQLKFEIKYAYNLVKDSYEVYNKKGEVISKEIFRNGKHIRSLSY